MRNHEYFTGARALWRSGRSVFACCAVCMVLLVAGCVQLDATIKLNEDGSAVVTERLNFSLRLLEMDKGSSGGKSLLSLLSREAAAERAKLMGPGVKLVGFEEREGEKGSRECLATYAVPNLTNLVYVSPFFGWKGYQAQALTFSMAPQGGWEQWSGRWVSPGSVIVKFETSPYPAATADRAKTAEGTNSPSSVQMYRDLAPLFADLLKDLRVRITLETYAPIGNYQGIAHRDLASNVNHTDLVNLSGEQMDRYGYGFVENEEIMVDLLQGHLGLDARDPSTYGPSWASNLGGMQENAALPLINQGRRGAVMLAPSRTLFARYFEGKTLDWTNTYLALKSRGRKLANFDEVGWKPQSLPSENADDNCPPACPWCR